jgi:hypothetical protein
LLAGKTKIYIMRKIKTNQLLDKFHAELMNTDGLRSFAAKLKSHFEINYIRVTPNSPINIYQFNKLIASDTQLEIKDIQDIKNTSEYIKFNFKEIIAKWAKLLNNIYQSEDLTYESKVVTILETKYLLESIANAFSMESRNVFAPNAYFAVRIQKERTPQRIPFEYLKLSPSALKKLSEVFTINGQFFQELAQLSALAVDKLIILSYTQKKYELPSKPGKNLVAALAIALTKTPKPLLTMDTSLHQTLLDDLTTFFGLEPMKIYTVLNDLMRNNKPSQDLIDLANSLDTLKKNRPPKK